MLLISLLAISITLFTFCAGTFFIAKGLHEKNRGDETIYWVLLVSGGGLLNNFGIVIAIFVLAVLPDLVA